MKEINLWSVEHVNGDYKASLKLPYAVQKNVENVKSMEFSQNGKVLTILTADLHQSLVTRLDMTSKSTTQVRLNTVKAVKSTPRGFLAANVAFKKSNSCIVNFDVEKDHKVIPK